MYCDVAEDSASFFKEQSSLQGTCALLRTERLHKQQRSSQGGSPNQMTQHLPSEQLSLRIIPSGTVELAPEHWWQK